MAAATGTKQQQQHPHPAPPPGATVVDPKFEWAEKAGSYVLRLTLQGFKKDDFRVQVDGAGRLTVRGTRPGASLHKVFQLPSAAILDDIAGRFEAGVLTLTVPKRAGANKGEIAPKMAPTEQVEGAMKTGDAGGENKAPKAAPSTSSAVAPTSVEEIRAKPKEEGAKKMPTMDDDDEKKEGVTGVEPKESVLSRTARLVAEQVQRMEEAANRRKQEQQKPAPAAKKEQEIVEVKPKAPQMAAATMTPAPKPTLGEKSKAVVEEERAKAATAATSMEARAEQEKKAMATAFTTWKERMTEGLGQLTDMKWADSAVEMARKNKEVVAVGIAAFSLGFFISHRLFRK